MLLMKQLNTPAQSSVALHQNYFLRWYGVFYEYSLSVIIQEIMTLTVELYNSYFTIALI